MSWFNECTLTYEEFEKILLYLRLFRTIMIEVLGTKGELFVDDHISKLDEWLKKE